jgi:hypothetical protein
LFTFLQEVIMTKTIKTLFAGLLLLLSASSFAQCVPMNGEYRNQYGFVENQPRVYDPVRRCHVPAGTAQLQQQTGGGQVFMANNGTQFQIPQGIGYGQPFQQVVGGVQYSCTLSQRVESGITTGLVAGGLTWLVEKVTKQPNNDASATAFGAGVAYGATIGCTPMNTISGGGQQVMQGQQQIAQGNPCADQGRIPVNVNGQTLCKLPNTPQQQAVQVQQVAQVNPCADQGRIAVYKPDGNVGCKLPGAPAQPGERAYP